MKLSLIFELLFMTNVIAVSIMGSQHTRAFFNSSPKFSTAQDLKHYRDYVSLQMWYSIAFLLSIVPAILCGTYFTFTTAGLITYAPIILYLIPVLIGRSTRPMEKQLRAASIGDPVLQAEYDNISYVWQKKVFPKFDMKG